MGCGEMRISISCIFYVNHPKNREIVGKMCLILLKYVYIMVENDGESFTFGG